MPICAALVRAGAGTNARKLRSKVGCLSTERETDCGCGRRGLGGDLRQRLAGFCCRPCHLRADKAHCNGAALTTPYLDPFFPSLQLSPNPYHVARTLCTSTVPAIPRRPAKPPVRCGSAQSSPARTSIHMKPAAASRAQPGRPHAMEMVGFRARDATPVLVGSGCALGRQWLCSWPAVAVLLAPCQLACLPTTISSTFSPIAFA